MIDVFCLMLAYFRNDLHPWSLTCKLKMMVSKSGISKLPGAEKSQVKHVQLQWGTAEATLWASSLVLLDQGDTITFNSVISTPCHWEIAWSYVTCMKSRSVRTDAWGQQVMGCGMMWVWFWCGRYGCYIDLLLSFFSERESCYISINPVTTFES